MRKINLPTNQMDKLAGQWVVIDPVKNKITAIGKTLKEISHFVTNISASKKPVGKAPYSFKVPRKDEGPYVLWINQF